MTRRFLALSIERPTLAFRQACDALTLAEHIVDLKPERSFSDPCKGYNGLLLSLGDYSSDYSCRVKLAAVRASLELPTIYFLDRPLTIIPSVEMFWKSALFGETASAMMHRSQMHRAMREDWYTRIEGKLFEWRNPPPERTITPALDSLNVTNGWDPTAVYCDSFRPIATRKEIEVLEMESDEPVDHRKIARSRILFRKRAKKEIVSDLWMPLAVVAASHRTYYADPAWHKSKLPEKDQVEVEADKQRRELLGSVRPVAKAVEELSNLVVTMLRRKK